MISLETFVFNHITNINCVSKDNQCVNNNSAVTAFKGYDGTFVPVNDETAVSQNVGGTSLPCLRIVCIQMKYPT